jgi:hypothetical protein
MLEHGSHLRRRTTAWIKALVATLAFGAAITTSRPSHALVQGGGALWPGGIVRVCWETQMSPDGGGNPVNPHTRADWVVLSNAVRDAMRNTWGRVANIEFSGFEDCTSNMNTAMAGWVAINLALPPCAGTGCPQNGNTHEGYVSSSWTRMRLNPDLNGASSDDFRAQVIHETGHALGFTHEYFRTDNPRNTGCYWGANDPTRVTGTTYGTPYDAVSMMNYSYDGACTPETTLQRPFHLSPYDIVGIQNAYGRHSSGELVAESGACMNIPMPYSVGATLQTYECQQNGANSFWQLRSDNLITAPYYNSFLDVPWAQTWAGLQLDSNNVNTPISGNQQWHPTNGVQIRGMGETCLDIPNGNIANGQTVQIYNCNGGWNQQWRTFPDGTIRPAWNIGYCIDVPWGWNGQGNVLQLWQCWGGVNQQFRFDNSGAIVFNVAGGNCLNVQGGTPTPGSAVQLYPCNNGANELWHLSLSISGTNNLCVESQASSSANHTSVIQNTCSAVPGQQWDYYPNNFTGFN